MDDASNGAWTLVVEEATLEGIALIIQACQAGIRGAHEANERLYIGEYLSTLHEIALAELLVRTGKGR